MYAKGANKRYNVEMFSSAKHKPHLRRARYYQSMMDRLALEPGMDYITLPESYVIFVCNFDYFGTGQAVCKRKMVIEGLSHCPHTFKESDGADCVCPIPGRALKMQDAEQ